MTPVPGLDGLAGAFDDEAALAQPTRAAPNAMAVSTWLAGWEGISGLASQGIEGASAIAGTGAASAGLEEARIGISIGVLSMKNKGPPPNSQT